MFSKVALLVREAVSDTSDNKKWVREPMALVVFLTDCRQRVKSDAKNGRREGSGSFEELQFIWVYYMVSCLFIFGFVQLPY